MAEKRKISLVLADVDGTLVTEQKVLTKRAQAAVHSLRGAGIRFAVTSGRPAKGMAMLLDAASARYADLWFQRRARRQAGPHDHRPEDGAGRCRRQVGRTDLRAHGLDVWVYRGNDWLVGKADGPHVEHEAWTVKFSPKVVTDVAAELDQVSKVVGVSDDLDKVQRCEADAQAAFGQRATANRSQPYYLDVTNKDANKGAVVEFCRGISACRPRRSPPSATSRPTCRCSSARASASPWATPPTRSKAQASAVTDSYNDEGFAKAMERFILVAACDERAHRSPCGSGGARTPRRRVDDSGGPCGERPLPGVAFRRIDAQGSVRAARLR